MLSKSTRPQLLNSRPFYETASSSRASDKSDTSRGSQLGLGSNNPPTFGSNVMSTQPFAFQYRFMHGAPQLTQNNRKNAVVSGNGTVNGLSNYQYSGMNTSWTTQRSGYGNNNVSMIENSGEKQKMGQVTQRNTVGPQFPYRRQESGLNFVGKGQDMKKEDVVIEEEVEIVSQKTKVEKTKKSSVMNEVGSLLISNLESLRAELNQDLEKCQNTEDVQKTFLGKINMFDETLKKVLRSHQQLGGQLRRVEGVFEEQFEVIFGEFEKSNQKMESAQEALTRKLNSNQTAYYRRADNVKKGVENVKKFMKDVIRTEIPKVKKANNPSKNVTNPQKSRLMQNKKREERSHILVKGSPEDEVRCQKRSHPWSNEANVQSEMPKKRVKGETKGDVGGQGDQGDRQANERMEVEKPRMGVTLRPREAKKII